MEVDERINAVKEVVEGMDKMETVVIESTDSILNKLVESIDWEGKKLSISFHESHDHIQYDGHAMRLFNHKYWETNPENCFKFAKYTESVITREEKTDIFDKLWPVFQTLVDLRLATNDYHYGIPENIYINCRRIKW